MADPLYELLQPHFDTTGACPSATSAATADYLLRLSTLSAPALTTTEPDSLSHNAQSLLTSLQALAKRSFRSINTCVEALEQLQKNIPEITTNITNLQAALPALDNDASNFAQKYSKTAENSVLDRRRRLMRLGDNVDRLSDMLELPTLLSSTITASTTSSSSSGSSTISSANAHYTSALDLYAHIRRLQRLYPDSELVKSIVVQAEEAMRAMTTNLISALRSQSLKLAGGMRLIGLLRRVAPELDDRLNTTKTWTAGATEGSLGALFIVCRLANLVTTIEALEPLKELADQETRQRTSEHPSKASSEKNSWSAGQQTERYLKRYIEVFREQCFAIISMYKSIFPASLAGPSAVSSQDESSARNVAPRIVTGQPETPDDPMQKLPPALATFTMHIVDLFVDTLRIYMPNIRDQSSRDSLLTQVLYCAASLGRLGGDFGMMLSMLQEDLEEASVADGDEAMDEEEQDTPLDPEWVQVMKRHRVAAGRLDLLASGVASSSDRTVMSPVRENAMAV